MLIVLKNEPTASLRCMYFHCVDVTDGMTPETGEVGGQPQILVSGAWTNTGIGVLVAIGNGRYYAELTQGTTNIADRSVIEGRYKSANTAEAVGTTVQVVEYPVDASVAARPTNPLLANAALIGTDGKALISTDAQDLSTHLDVNVKTKTSTLGLSAQEKLDVNAEADTANTDYGANKIAPNTVVPDAAGVVNGLLNTKIPTALTFTGSDVKATLDGEEVTPTTASKTGYALSVVGIDAILDEVTEGTMTLRNAVKIMLSALAAKSSGGGTTTLIFKDIGDTKPRIIATVDANGNRTAITLDGA